MILGKYHFFCPSLLICKTRKRRIITCVCSTETVILRKNCSKGWPLAGIWDLDLGGIPPSPELTRGAHCTGTLYGLWLIWTLALWEPGHLVPAKQGVPTWPDPQYNPWAPSLSQAPLGDTMWHVLSTQLTPGRVKCALCPCAFPLCQFSSVSFCCNKSWP